MDYKYLIEKIIEYGNNYPLIDSVDYDDVYSATAKDNVKYPLLVIDYSPQHQLSNPISTINLDLHYIDNLLEDFTNKLDIQNTTFKVFNDLLLMLQEIDGVDTKIDENKTIEFFQDTLGGSNVTGGTLSVSILIVTNDFYCQIIK